MNFSLAYGLTLIAGFLLALIFTPLSRALAIASGFLDYPKQDRVHRRPTPFLGGLAVAVSAGLAFALLAPQVPMLGEMWNKGHLPRAIVPWTLLMACAALILGLVDDRLELSPLTKLAGQLAICVAFLTPSISLGWSALWLWPLGLLWTVGLLNAFNLLDNMDGILSGVGTLIGLFLGAVALSMGRPDLAAFALAAGGASLGFLCFNFPPATIFLGDAGAFFIGMLMAGVGWQLAGAEFLQFTSGAAAVILVLSYPIFDVTFVTITRCLDRRPIHVGGIDHTTHRLYVLFGRGHKALWTVYSLCALSGLAGILALNVAAPIAWSLVVVAACLYSSLGFILARVPVRSRSFLSAFYKADAVADREVA